MSNLLQFKVQLKNIKPAIYRNIIVPENASFSQLHEILQHTMGWFNCHLFQFKMDRNNYILIPDKSYDDYGETHDARKIKIKDYFAMKKSIVYEYDFGDSWEHTVTLTKVLENENKIDYAICMKGQRSCPPEDCGGPWGYENFLAAILDNKNPEHNEMLEWVGGEFDPGEFDLEHVNGSIKKIKIKI
jgi:Plasmid pRiA4b ORF-3-like protein